MALEELWVCCSVGCAKCSRYAHLYWAPAVQAMWGLGLGVNVTEHGVHTAQGNVCHV